MEKKTTKREIINSMLALDEIVANEVYVNFLKHELELLDKKSENKKPSKSRQESDKLVDVVIDTLRELEEPATVTTIIKSNQELADCSTQRLTSILKRIDGIQNTIIKGKSYYSLWAEMGGVKPPKGHMTYDISVHWFVGALFSYDNKAYLTIIHPLQRFVKWFFVKFLKIFIPIKVI